MYPGYDQFGVSFSAPKAFNFSAAGVSRASASTFQVENHSIPPRNIFFNPDVPFEDLATLAHDTIEEVAERSPQYDNFLINQQRYRDWVSKSCNAKPLTGVAFHKALLPPPKEPAKSPMPTLANVPPPGLANAPPPGLAAPPRRRNWADMSPNSDFTPTPGPMRAVPVPIPAVLLSEPNITLQAPPKRSAESKKVEEPVDEGPKKSIKKREDRGSFDSQHVTEERYSGRLKFYQMKKRFGFITLQQDPPEDVFLCEDDIILSGLNHKKFKENIVNRIDMLFHFNIKQYVERGRDKKKAVNICIDCVATTA